MSHMATTRADTDTRSLYQAPALMKGLDIVELLVAQDRAMSINEISEKLDRTRNEIVRMIHTLEERDYIARSSADGKYEVTNKMFEMGLSRNRNQVLLEVAVPLMHALNDHIQQSSHLAVPSMSHIVNVAEVDDPGPIRLSLRLGHIHKMAKATSVQLLFAHQPADVRETWLRWLMEDGQVDDADAFMRTADELSGKPFVSRESVYVSGVTDICAPVFADGRAVAALAVPFIRKLNTNINVRAAGKHVLATARAISEQLRTR